MADVTALRHYLDARDTLQRSKEKSQYPYKPALLRAAAEHELILALGAEKSTNVIHRNLDTLLDHNTPAGEAILEMVHAKR